MEYYAHKTETGKQTVKEHLNGVAKLASGFSIEKLKQIAFELGELHDIGKYAYDFQDRLLNGSKNRYEHSVCGAIELGKAARNDLEKEILYMFQYCIAGHHTGLPDGGTENDTAADSTLHGKLSREKLYTGSSDYSAYKNEVEVRFPDIEPIIRELENSSGQTDMIEKYAFFTRYLFSCLTDADFIDTERFCAPETDRTVRADFNSVSKAVDKEIASFKSDTQIRQARKRLQEQAYAGCKNGGNISFLNMPTGSGKTLCSLKIALDKLMSSGKKRVIYVIPYTSIIEQTADTFNDIFGKYMDILQHHSNFCFEDAYQDESTAEKLKRSTENWDAPLIITTSVQFFQSLYHYKGSGLRKLHNLADAVIIFDEVHMLPEKYLQPCLRGIGYITKYLNSEAIFLSATMPDYSGLFGAYIPNCAVTELIRDRSDFEYFRKCRYEYLGETEYDSIIERSTHYKSNLIIVNKRRTAREIYKKLTGNKFHLSTYMTPNDRSAVIEKIRSCLKEEKPVTVVSTSLIEAGVDLDFETVFREMSGLDSILQSGGRCNREGKRECGNVFVFETDEKPGGEISVRANIVKHMLKNGIDISTDAAVKEYYNRLFRFNEDVIKENTIAKNISGFGNIPFRTYYENFKLIDADTVNVVIDNCDKTRESISLLEYGKLSEKRKLQKYSVALRTHGEFDKALSLGLIRDTEKGVFVLADNNYYNSETGLDLDMTNDIIF